MKSKNNWLKILALSLLALALVGVLVYTAYFLGQKNFQIKIVKNPGPKPTLAENSQPTLPSRPTVTPMPDPTADWLFYTNTQGGYQFKHPRGWLFTAKSEADETKPLYVIRQTVTSKNVNDLVQIKTWHNPNRLSLADWIEFMKDSNAFTTPTEEMATTANANVDKEPALRFWNDPISKGQEPGKCFQACPILSVYFTHADKAFVIEDVYLKEPDAESRQLFNQFLATFHFL